MAEPRRSHLVMVACAGLALLLVAFWQWSSPPIDPLVPAVASTTTTPSDQPPRCIDGEAAADVGDSEAAPEQLAGLRRGTLGRIRGLLRLRDGDPAAEVVVRLRRNPGERPSEPKLPPLGISRTSDPFATLQNRRGQSWQQASDGAGRFDFTDLEAGEYTLTADLGILATERVQLAAGEERDIVLEFAAAVAWLSGCVRGEAAAGDLRLSAGSSSGKPPRQIPIGADGRFQHLLPVGQYRLRLGLQIDAQAQSVEVASCEVVAEAGGQLRWEPFVQCGSLTVTLVHPGLLRLGNLAAVLQAEVGAAPTQPLLQALGRGAEKTKQFDAAGRITFRGLALGHYRLTLRGGWIMDAPVVPVELTPTAAHPVVELAPEPCGIVQLQVLDERGGMLRLGDCQIALVTAAKELAGEDLRLRHSGRRFREQFGWTGVPVGPATLRLADQRCDGEHVFLPFDPPLGGTLAVAVQPGDQNVVELRAVRRAQVRLVAVDEVGRELPGSQIQVYWAGTPVRSQAGRRTRWEGSLPPGDYMVVIERPSGRREYGLPVGRQDLERRLRP